MVEGARNMTMFAHTVFTVSLPGLTSQVGSTRPATLITTELGQARVPVQSILLCEQMDARVNPAHDEGEVDGATCIPQ
jgi:hypothetical protein